jgi:hypothetical protein
VAGYGELEFDLCRCLAAVWNDEVAAVQEVFKLRGEQKWMEIHQKRARPAYAMVDLSRNTNKAPRDQKLLRRQELHFMYARACMDYLKHAYDPYRGRGANPFEKVPWQDPPRTYLDKLAGKSEPWSAGLKQREERPPHAST